MKEDFDKDKQFNFNKFWGASNIAQHVLFKRGSEMYCIYCGESADTREHCPSRAFLEKPYPTNLPTLPACKRCNNGFSADENYTKNLINFLYMHYIQEKDIEKSSVYEDRETRDAYNAAIKFIKEQYFDDRIANVFRKLAIGHAAYEISTGYYSKEWKGKPVYISYILKPMLDNETWEGLECVEIINEDIMPELGSRVFRNIYVLQMPLLEVKTGDKKFMNVCVLDWTDVQEEQYKYQAFIKQDKICVKMIFKEFLYAEVVFEREM